MARQYRQLSNRPNKVGILAWIDHDTQTAGGFNVISREWVDADELYPQIAASIDWEDLTEAEAFALASQAA